MNTVDLELATDSSEHYRRELAALYRAMSVLGWDDLIFTHISAQIGDSPGHYLMNRLGALFGEMTPDRLELVNENDGITPDWDGAVNPAGFNIHSALHHKGREDICWLVHLHSDAGVGVSCLEEGFLPLNQTAMLVYEDIAYHSYEGVSLDQDERERLAVDLGDKNILILRNHGTLVAGKTCEEVFLRTYWYEKACQIQWGLGSRAARLPDKKIISVVTEQANDVMRTGGARLAWNAMKREIAAKMPDTNSWLIIDDQD